MNNKTLHVQITVTPFLHRRTSCLETGMVTIPQINFNLYSVSRIIAFEIQRRVHQLELKLSRRNHSIYRQDNSR
ncbi:hypothetical protein BAZSYMA_ACONTIG61458_1 [Bathymodiolus azoricus thioautotrophic gill symbiont]|uniref:Uncharacterized protein n=1 Tax=Bathymodiolus azoricus thioautotrophic gill symbiont TaxID=235205 RepID=A0A1H6JPR1_9GAMM|nr:hypothetical protein BAZSYMA_ACONTIG61458_1 [Bathymodiolus azoricus thioautotrophic gill symbiont]